MSEYPFSELFVQTTHGTRPQTFLIHNVSENTATTQYMPYDGKDITIQEFFMIKYDLALV